MNLVKEPLIHFLLLSGLLFLGFQLVSKSDAPTSEEVLVSEGRLATLALTFEKVWRRPPSSTELDGLVQDYVREEILYREAVAMGLDKDDMIVRRRLRQKLEFLSEDLVRFNPSDDDLQVFINQNKDMFRQETRFSFRHVYFNAGQRGASLASDIQRHLSDLEASYSDADSDAEIEADSIMIPAEFDTASERELIRILGFEFLKGLQSSPLNKWHGPIASGFGAHLVYVRDRIDGLVPQLSDIRESVVREWTAVERKKSNEAFYLALRSRYKVTIESYKAQSQIETASN